MSDSDFVDYHELLPACISLDRLLKPLKVDASRVPVELDGQVVRKPEWPAAIVREGSHIEVVWFVGGGAN